MADLDIDGVRVFLTVADLRSFTRAAEALGTTQGAVSVKLRRLEDRLGKRLIERTPRQVRLSVQGEIFIEPARAFLQAHEYAIASLSAVRRHFKLGIGNHVMGPGVTAVLGKLKSLDPALTVEVTLDDARSLLDGYEAGSFDAIIVRSDDDRRNGETLGPEHFGWYASSHFTYGTGEVLPLAVTPAGCPMRELAMRSLDQMSVPWQEVFTGGTTAIAAALSAGLAVAAFPRRLAPSDLLDVGDSFQLPALPTLSLVLHSSLSDTKSRETLRAITAAFRESRH